MATILLGIWLILVGLDWGGWVHVSLTLQAILAIVTGALFLYERFK